MRGRKWQQQAKEQTWSSTADPILVHVVCFPNSNAKVHLLSQRKDKILPPEQQNSVNKCVITSFFVSLVAFDHGLSQNQPLCFFVYLLLFLFMVFHRPTPMFLCLSLVVSVHGFSQDQLNASLFIFYCFCSWFFSQN